MEIRSKRYQEMVRAELTMKMIREFINREKGEISAEAMVNHISWLIKVCEEQKEEIK